MTASSSSASASASSVSQSLVVLLLLTASSSTTCCHGFSMQTSLKRSVAKSSSTTASSSITMDSGEDFAFVKVPFTPSSSSSSNIPASLRLPPQQQQQHQQEQHDDRMPWKESIDPSHDVTFMPFWEYQMDFMTNQLQGLTQVPVTNKKGTVDFTIAVSSIQKKKNQHTAVRVANACFSSDDFRKIRMTYYDAGTQAQVYNSLWYPDPIKYPNMPVLGIDLLQFNGGKKHLLAIDFQPLSSNDDNIDRSYEDILLKPIRDEHPLLQGRMTKRFYDESSFFSTQMLFGRLEEEGKEAIWDSAWPAFIQYLSAYLQLMTEHERKSGTTGTAASSTSTDASSIGLERQRAYDVYSANRDPAIHMFKAKFGEKWADEYVHEFLFDLCR